MKKRTCNWGFRAKKGDVFSDYGPWDYRKGGFFFLIIK